MSDILVRDADAGRHIGDDDLVKILDGASTTAAAWSAHFTGCTVCHTRVTELTSAAAALRVAYGETPIPDHFGELPLRLRVREQAPTPARSSWASGRFAKRAAAILLLASVGTAAAATIRSLVRDAGTASGHASPSPVVAAPVRTRVDTASIAFRVSTGVITLDFASVPGVLRARLGNTDTLRLLVTSSDSLHAAPAEPSLIALPDGIRIVNTLTPRAGYDVILPAAAQELRVRLAGREVSVLRRPGMSSDRNITVPVAARALPQ
jgi:hypothetical protein